MKYDFNFVKKVYTEAMDEDITSNAAQVGFYFIFALFPLLLFTLSLIGMVLGAAEGIRDELFSYLHQVIPGSALDVIQESLSEVTDNGSGGKLTFGALLTLWSASAGVDNIRIALNDVYDLKETRSWWKYKLTSLLLTLGIALLIFLALGVVFYGSQFINVLLQPIGLSLDSSIILNVFSFLIVVVALLTSFALIYAFAPNHSPFKWKWITPGAVTALVLWLVLSGAFRLYLHFFDSYSKTYGSVGAIIILLLWLYLTALVVLVGGIINAVGEQSSPSNKDEQAKSEKLSDDKQE